ncbi:hypothetical protein D3C85_1543030 [compost metagenome]
MSEVSALEQQLAGLKLTVEKRDMAQRLARNPDFRKLILEEFMVNECARYVHTSSDPNVPESGRQDALNIAQAAGHLKRFLSVMIQMGNSAADTLGDVEAALDEARAEEGDA